MILLTIIFIAFIGLGVPDSMFGTAWPAIYAEWQLPISFGSFITSTVYIGTMVSSLFSTSVIKRFGTARVSAFSTALTAFAMLGFSLSGSFWMLCLCAIPLGLGAGAIDTALNNYMASNYSARYMNYMHCFYGVGIIISPYILSRVMSEPDGWHDGYLIVCGIQTVIAVLLFFSIPLWNKDNGNDREKDFEDIPLRTLVRMRKVRLMWGLFLTSCTIETSCSCYASTFLVEQQAMAVRSAALVVMLYFVGITVGRFLSGLAPKRLSAWQICIIGEWILAVGITVLLIGDTIGTAAVGLLLIGFGNGPLFPNFIYITPMVFGQHRSSSVIGSLMAVASLTGITAPVLCGLLGQSLGMRIFPYFIMAFFIVMAVVSVIANREFWKEK